MQYIGYIEAILRPLLCRLHNIVDTHQSDSIVAAVQALREFGVVPGIAARLRDDSTAAAQAVLDTVIREVPPPTVLRQLMGSE